MHAPFDFQLARVTGEGAGGRSKFVVRGRVGEVCGALQVDWPTHSFRCVSFFSGVSRHHFQTISLGQGQGPIASNMITKVSAPAGGWYRKCLAQEHRKTSVCPIFESVSPKDTTK